jgi:hypothetical protein
MAKLAPLHFSLFALALAVPAAAVAQQPNATGETQ